MNDLNQDGILQSRKVANVAIALMVVAMAYLAVQSLAVLQNPPNATQNVITVSGEGKASAAPDLATISFTVSEDADTASSSQDAAAKKVNAALAALKNLQIDDKDIQTSSYNVYPRYSQNQPCIYNGPIISGAGAAYPPCPPTESKVIGYTASQTVTVKLHDVNSVGTVVTALGQAGISNLNGPDFSVENPDAVQSEARKDAIDQAHAKAEELAKELGVRLVRVVNYSEGGGYYPGPMMEASGAATGKAATVPSIPTGQNEVTLDVTVTYEIR